MTKLDTRVFVLNTKTRETYEHNVPTYVCDEETGATCMHTSALHELIGCDCIDITCRFVEGQAFDFIVDDEGLLTDDPIVSALDSKMNPMLAGNLVICRPPDELGSEVSLTDEDVALLERHCRFVMREDGMVLRVIVGVEYYPDDEEEEE